MLARQTRNRGRVQRPHNLSTLRRIAPLATLALVLALGVAGCGAAGTAGAANGTGASGTPTPSASVNPGGPRKTSVRPCLGPSGSVSDVSPPPTVVLTPASAYQAATAHVGDIIQVRLSTTRSWRYLSSASDKSGALELLQPASIQDGSLGVCVWNFKAQSVGTATLNFAGSPVCDQPNAVCPQNVLALTFTINVS